MVNSPAHDEHMQDSQQLIGALERRLAELQEVFRKRDDEFFFTEKELHASFYHLCMSDDTFVCGPYSLLHAEYPTPFKCSYPKGSASVRLEPIKSKAQRSHIDCVLVNPRFVEWLLRQGGGINELIGIGRKRFDLYIPDFYETYARFNREVKAPILLYALEFKFFRHGYVGPKYAVKAIRQDIAKLRLLRTFSENASPRVNFVGQTKAVIFVADKTKNYLRDIQNALNEYNRDEYLVISRGPGLK